MELRGDGGAVDTGLPSGWAEFTDPVTHKTYYWHAESETASWTIPSPDLSASLPTCTAPMIKSSYTRCDPASATRSLAFYHNVACKNGVPLPPTVPHLPCNVTCNPGEYLPLGEPGCAPCEPGTYSVGGGSKYMNWETLPEGFSTYCVFQLDADQGTPCSGWELNGTFIGSGEMRGKRLVDSVLELKVDLIRPGSVAFEYIVDAERRWDGVYFMIDGEVKMDMSSYQFQYESMAYPLTPGYHTLQWIYHKDVAYEMGADRASIRAIQVLGTMYNTEHCDVCPKGHFSTPGSAECQKCAVNTYADKSGAAQCKPCNAPGQAGGAKYAFPGATKCLPAKPCTRDDIAVSFSQCDGKKRTKSEAYIQPQICHGGATPAADQQVDCAPCDSGMYWAGGKAGCKYCPSGKFNPKPTHQGIQACTMCPSGQIAKKVDWFDETFGTYQFQSYLESGEMATGCVNGFCGTGGWRALGDKLDTGVGNGEVADIWLSLEVWLETEGEVMFNYSTRISNSENRLQFYIDDARMWGVEMQQAQSQNDQVIEYITPVPAGPHFLTWVFHKEREYSWMTENMQSTGGLEDRAVLEQILVTGVTEGGAVECEACPAGYVADKDRWFCSACPAGKFSAAEGGEECQLCPAGKFSMDPGSKSCKACGHGTMSKKGSATCDVSPTQCRYEVDEETVYDLSALARTNNEPMWGPVLETNRSNSYFINICSQEQSNQSCTGRDGQGVRAYACQKSLLADDFHENNLAVSLGDVMAFYTRKKQPRKGLIVSFEGGDLCQNGEQRSLNITMICDRDVGPGQPEVIPGTAVEDEKCRYNLVWRSQHACPMCTEKDMKVIKGECGVTGKRPINMIWKEPKQCYGGQDIPDLHYEPCTAVVIDKGRVTLIALVSVCVFGVLIGALVFMHLRNKRIYREYSVLREQNEADVELRKYTGETYTLDD